MAELSGSEVQIENEFKKINSLSDSKQLLKALKRCERLYREYPEHPRVLQGLGLLRFRTGEHEEGERLVRRAIELKPDYCDAYYNLGTMLQFFPQKMDEAETVFRKVIELSPDNYKAFASLANVLNRKLRCNEAIPLCEQAIRINPRHDETYGVMGSIMLSIGKVNDSIGYYRKAISLRKNETAHSSLLFAMNASPDILQPEIYKESIIWGRLHTSHLTRKARPHLNSPNPDRRLRIGYVSGDFRTHPVAYYIRPILASHDKLQVEVFLYNNFPTTDTITDELTGYAEYYRHISGLLDEKVAEIIRNDGIDILVDLTGHTAFYRLHLFACRPAPVQVTWLGYFNTTGVAAIDYLLSDTITIPQGEEKYYAEKVVRLPDCRFCYTPPVYAPEVTYPPSLRLGYITFGSFNKIVKTNDKVIALWSALLNAVPGSKLMLKWMLLKDSGNIDELKRRFASHGIDADRLIMRPNTPHQEMLAEYGDVDIALDTFPYNGGTTTCEALWMGVPVVTMEGDTPIGRQSMAFLHTIGCREWVAKSEEEYLEIAVKLASNPTTLAGIRSSLRQKMSDSPLCNGKLFTTNLETAYRSMWKRWCSDTGCTVIKPGSLKRFKTDEIYSAGVHSMTDGDHNRAAQFFDYVLKRDPTYIKAANNLGISLFMTGKNAESIRAFRRAIRQNKGSADAYTNLGRVYLEMGESRKALSLCRRSVEIEPGHVDALINLQNVCRHMGLIGEARRSIEKVLELSPDNVRAVRFLSALMQEYGENAKAIALLEGILEKHPENLEVISTLLWVMQHEAGTEQEDLFRLSRKFGKVVEHNTPVTVIYNTTSLNKNHLKIGFVSADFCLHPVGFLLRGFFSHHDPARISLYCYYNGLKNDSLTGFYRSTAAGWRDIHNMSDTDAAELIKNDGIDILIDLSGHTDGYRLPLFALKPAPVQATWLGYCNTTGLSSMDYIIADGEMIREEEEKLLTERVVRLPHNRFCFTPPTQCPEVVEPPYEYNGHITFGCFNKTAKVTPHVIECWSRILSNVPRSRLIMKCRSFKDESVRNHFRQAFSGYGIARSRLEFRKESNSYFMMLEYGDVDIVLDPFPYSGGMTSLDALWMGVPVITRNGDLPISRQTKSFLVNIGMEELVAEGDGQYAELAVELANDPERLHNMRASMRDRMLNSTLCDERGFAISIQNALFEMWSDTCCETS